jgi:SecD/SecF fusion protein
MEASADIETKLYNSISRIFAGNESAGLEMWSIEGKEYGIMSNFQVGPTIADDILTGSLYAILVHTVVFLYILIASADGSSP